MDPETHSGETLVSRYRIRSRLGKGAFGVVYLAEDLLRLKTGQHAEVAVKEIDPHLARQVGGLAGMATRLSAACRVTHPNMLNVFDFHEEDGQMIVVMERLEGRRLEDVIDENEPMSQTEAAPVLAQIIEGLAYAHKHGCYLRLDPEKLWLREDGRVKIADIGLAPHLDRNLWTNRAIESGAAVYLAPEVIGGTGTPDGRADQYSIAVIAIELLTGSSAIRDPNVISELERRCQASWVEALRRMLEHDPAKRFDDIGEALPYFKEDGISRSWARRRFSPGTKLRTHWRRAALVLGAAALVIFGFLWSTGNDEEELLSKQFANEKHAVETLLRTIDDRRLELYSAGLGRSEFDAAIKRFCNSRPEFEAAADLGRAELVFSNRGDSLQETFAVDELRVELTERQRELDDALHAIEACDRLAKWIESRESLQGAIPCLTEDDGKVGLSPQPQVPDLDVAFRRAVDSFSAGVFSAATREATEAAEAFQRAVTTDVHALADAAEVARQAWQDELKKRQLPTTLEPLGEPSDLLGDGRGAMENKNWPAAVAAFEECRQLFARWTLELGSVPDLRPGDRENSLGMRFREVDGLDGLLVSIWETRVIDFLAYIDGTGIDPSRQWREFALETGQGPLHPAAFIDHNDAQRFGEWLTGVERASAKIDEDQAYRLPSDREWSRAVGLPVEQGETPEKRRIEFPDHYPWGSGAVRSASHGNYDTFPNRDSNQEFIEQQDSFRWTSPVGSFAPNAYGLYDMGGNVFEWLGDRLHSIDNPTNDGEARGGGNHDKLLRGGSWRTFSLDSRRSGHRQWQLFGYEDSGFRIVLGKATTADSDAESQIKKAHGG